MPHVTISLPVDSRQRVPSRSVPAVAAPGAGNAARNSVRCTSTLTQDKRSLERRRIMGAVVPRSPVSRKIATAAAATIATVTSDGSVMCSK
jgi:hypothetical protein